VLSAWGKGVINVTAAYGQATSISWAALAIGGLVVVILMVTATVARRRHHHNTAKERAVDSSTQPSYPPNHPVVRIRLLIEEAMIVRERLSGHIDAATYQERMHDLVTRQHSSSPHPP
jgi:hypothetical protein